MYTKRSSRVHCTPRSRGGRAGGTVCVCMHVCLSGVWAAVCVHPEVEVVELVELTNERLHPSTRADFTSLDAGGFNYLGGQQ